MGQHLGLDRRAVLKAEPGDAVQQRRVQVQVVEAGLALFDGNLKVIYGPVTGFAAVLRLMAFSTA
jgi:hypothetical protein